MIRTYNIEWYPTKDGKYGRTPTIRISKLRLSKPTGKVEYDAKMALQIFMANHGNLNRNTIVKIKEFGDDGKQIGEDITPSAEENAIIPTMKKV